MKKAVLVILCSTLAATSAGAQQVCTPGIPQTTPTADFTDHSDGTITHMPTGLMWKRCLEGLSGTDCASGTWTTHTWQAAVQLADGHSFAGYSDWRLPNIKELGSIVELRCKSPAINLSVFPNDSSSDVWSGSPYAGFSPNAWYVSFNSGESNQYNRSKLRRVRLVRGGQ